jgi:uncharacterized membrane protein (UPF0127 family)
MNKYFHPGVLRQIVHATLFGLAMLVCIANLPVDAQQPQELIPNPVFLSIETRSGTERFIIEIADEQSEREVGLMYRTDLPQNRGMLFDFGTDRMVTMWMRNTPLSLDMIFIDRSGRIVRVAENTTPYSPAIISSQRAVRYVLELNAGVAAAKGIRAGDMVRHPLITRNNASQ